MTTPENGSALNPLEDLLDVLDLEPLGSAHITLRESHGDASTDFDLGESERDIFIGRSQPMPHGRVFGGQVLAQSVIAAGRTVNDLGGSDIGGNDAGGGSPRHIHSLHGYFLRPGDPEHRIRFAVERLRDGHSFSARRVHAIQNGKAIMSMIASFQTEAAGLDHQDHMPAAPDPERMETLAEVFAGMDDPQANFWSKDKAIDLRHVEGAIYLHPGRQLASRQSVWLKALGTMPEDPLVNAAVLAYCSDYSLLEPVLRKHGLAWSDRRLRVASLDHAMWFHRPGRVDDWILYTQSSPSASSGRGLAAARMFSSDGVLLATVAQEGMMRLKES
ncbi:MAG TPA: acyl-CoA thioesterase II [Dermatophilaceae bacterium]